MRDPNYDDTNWWIDLDDVMKEYKQDRGGGIVVNSYETEFVGYFKLEEKVLR